MQPIFHEARIRSGYRTKLKLTYKQTVPPAFADVCSNLASYNQSRQRVLGHEPALRAWDSVAAQAPDAPTISPRLLIRNVPPSESRRMHNKRPALGRSSTPQA